MGAFLARAGIFLALHGLALLLTRPLWIKALDALERQRPPFDVVIVDPGHGGADPGARSESTLEKHIALDVSQRLALALRRAGMPVALTRNSDSTLPLEQRVRLINTHRNPITVSIHCNHANNSTASGVETFFHGGKEYAPRTWRYVRLKERTDTGPSQSEELASEIQLRLAALTQAEDRGVKDRELFVLRNSRGAAALVEIGFLSNANEKGLLTTNHYLDTVATAITEAVLSYAMRQRLLIETQVDDNDLPIDDAPLSPATNSEEDATASPGEKGGQTASLTLNPSNGGITTGPSPIHRAARTL